MGQMRFVMPPERPLAPSAVERAYLAGMEGIPWRSRNTVVNDLLIVERAINESGNLYVPWVVPGHGELVLSTASLMERDRPYVLPLEMTRGTLHRLRNYSAELRQSGEQIPSSVEQLLDRAHEAFIEAATSQAEVERVTKLSDAALSDCLTAINELAVDGARQQLATRLKQGPQLHALLAGTVDALFDEKVAGQFVGAFNAASVPVRWREIEPQSGGQNEIAALEARMAWCHRHSLRICAGPLLQLDRASLPDWVYLWEDDFDELQSCVAEYIQSVVQRLKGKVQIWHAASGLNVGGELSLSEEQRLRLAVTVIDTLRSIDPQTPLVISFDQPWAEYLAKEDFDLSPIHFADALARADLGVAGLGLELNFGYWPGGTLPRDLLEIARQIDRWTYLGLPLLVSVTVPSGCQADPRAQRKADVVCAPNAGFTPQTQQEFLQRVLPLLLSKPAVHGLICNQTFDNLPHAFPHGGLFDANVQAKPALDAVRDVRRKYLT